MCHQTKCGKCQKASWAGCGYHVEPIFRTIPPAERCFCGFTEDEKKAAYSQPDLRSSMPKGGTCAVM